MITIVNDGDDHDIDMNDSDYDGDDNTDDDNDWWIYGYLRRFRIYMKSVDTFACQAAILSLIFAVQQADYNLI